MIPLATRLSLTRRGTVTVLYAPLQIVFAVCFLYTILGWRYVWLRSVCALMH